MLARTGAKGDSMATPMATHGYASLEKCDFYPNRLLDNDKLRNGCFCETQSQNFIGFPKKGSQVYKNYFVQQIFIVQSDFKSLIYNGC